MENYKVNENTIFTVSNGKLLAWNLDTGEQYEIYENRYLERIQYLTRAQSIPYTPTAEDQDLIDAGFLVPAKAPFEQATRGDHKWGWDDIAKIFHLGSKHNFPSDLTHPDENPELGYVDFCESIARTMPAIEIQREGVSTPLPAPSLSEIPGYLSDVLKQRKTSRHFSKAPVDLKTISNIMYATFGKIHGDSHQCELEKRGVKTVGYRRSSPSAGCLQATEAYLLALNVRDLKQGVYHYNAQQHCLTLVNNEIENLNKTLCHQTFSSSASFLIAMTSRFDKLWWKYPHSRAYRSALLDVGHVSQTYNLVATALGLNTWVTGYFIDDLLNKMLMIDGVKEHSIFVAAGGPGYSDPLSPDMKKLL